MDDAARVDALRNAFDGSFAEPPREAGSAPQNFLCLRVGGESILVRVSELAGFQVGRKIVPLDGGPHGFLGIAGIRGGLLPVFSLSMLLGQPAETSGRWMILCGTTQPIGLSVRDFDGHVRGLPEALFPANDAHPGREHVREFLQMESALRPIISIESLVAKIRNRAVQPAGEA